MNDDELKVAIESLQATVRETVNGKIDHLREDLKDHMERHDKQWEQIRPVVEGLQGARVIGGTFKWLGGIALTAAALFAIFKQ